jgi:predicted transcriptional regulator
MDVSPYLITSIQHYNPVKKMSDLLSIISASDKRRNLLILLDSGPKEWDEIKSSLKVTSTGMLPQIKILEEEHLITKGDDRKFSLTLKGKAISAHLEPLVKTIEVFEKYQTFWNEHNLNVIPEEIFFDIKDLGNYQLLDVPDAELFDVKCEKSSLIFTPSVFKIVSEKYRDLLEEYFRCEHASLYVSKDDIKFSCAVSDSYFSMSLFYNTGAFDSKHDVVSRDPSAIAWGERIFSYFLERSEKIEKLDQPATPIRSTREMADSQ